MYHNKAQQTVFSIRGLLTFFTFLNHPIDLGDRSRTNAVTCMHMANRRTVFDYSTLLN
jgi:hypothetical protein